MTERYGDSTRWWDLGLWARRAAFCTLRGKERVWLHRGPGQKPVSEDAVQICHDHGVEPVRGIHRFHHFVSRRRFAA